VLPRVARTERSTERESSYLFKWEVLWSEEIVWGRGKIGRKAKQTGVPKQSGGGVNLPKKEQQIKIRIWNSGGIFKKSLHPLTE